MILGLMGGVQLSLEVDKVPTGYHEGNGIMPFLPPDSFRHTSVLVWTPSGAINGERNRQTRICSMVDYGHREIEDICISRGARQA